MRISTQTNQHVCLSCRFGYYQTRAITLKIASERSNSLKRRQRFQSRSDAQVLPTDTPRASSSTFTLPRLRWGGPSTSQTWHKSAVRVRRYATHASVEPSAFSEPDMISSKQMAQIRGLSLWQKRLRSGLAKVPDVAQTDGVPFEEVINNLPGKYQGKSRLSLFLEVYAGKTFGEVESDLSKLVSICEGMKLDDVEGLRDVLTKLRVVDNGRHRSTQKLVSSRSLRKAKLHSATDKKIDSTRVQKTATHRFRKIGIYSARVRRRFSLLEEQGTITANSSEVTRQERRQARTGTNLPQSAEDLNDHNHTGHARRDNLEKDFSSMSVVDASAATLQPLHSDLALKVPKLSFDLSRVLFNPGVYQLKDARSKVYNFDPHLEKPMPVGQFNYEALNKYIPASEDEKLIQLAHEHNKKYTGSSSSLSGALSQFHFLLSAWRPLNFTNLSTKFLQEEKEEEDLSKNFTNITRVPSSVFLRRKNGVHAVDVDKQFDKPNVLMLLGHTIEKFLTLDKAEYERYRLKSDGSDNDLPESPPEAYHYSGIGDFIFRSQLDAQDERLPGSGVFDLKSRAVLGIRMNINDYEIGKGYEIRKDLGFWESYERELFDMIRSAFLKYSMQVRIGRMDGIFVAYHNIARTFGFQYLPLPELDTRLHGQTHRCLGDQEFNVSVSMLNEIFNRATEYFPNQSLRLTLETHFSPKTNPLGHMEIFAEAVGDDQIQSVQDQSKEKVEQKRKEILEAGSPTSRKVRAAESHAPLLDASEQSAKDQVPQDPVSPKQTPSTDESIAADVDFLDEISSVKGSDKSASKAQSTKPNPNLIGWTLHIYNFVNDVKVERPTDLKPEDRWSIRYRFERIPDSAVAGRYKGSKDRRRRYLGSERSADNSFLRRVREISVKGAAWRQQQDALEAEEGAGAWYKP